VIPEMSGRYEKENYPEEKKKLAARIGTIILSRDQQSLRQHVSWAQCGKVVPDNQGNYRTYRSRGVLYTERTGQDEEEQESVTD